MNPHVLPHICSCTPSADEKRSPVALAYACFLLYIVCCTTSVFDCVPMGAPAGWRKSCLKQAISRGSLWRRKMDIDLEPWLNGLNYRVALGRRERGGRRQSRDRGADKKEDRSSIVDYWSLPRSLIWQLFFSLIIFINYHTHPAAMCVTVLVIAQLGAWGMYRISTKVGIIILHLAEYMLGGTKHMSEKTQFSFIWYFFNLLT